MDVQIRRIGIAPAGSVRPTQHCKEYVGADHQDVRPPTGYVVPAIGPDGYLIAVEYYDFVRAGWTDQLLITYGYLIRSQEQ